MARTLRTMLRPSIGLGTNYEQAITFNGTTNYTATSAATGFNFTNMVSMGCWIKLTASSTGVVIMGNDSFRLELDGTFVTPVFVDAGNFATVGKSNTLKDLQWHFIVVTYNKINSCVYQDGVLISQEAHTNSLGAAVSNFTVGAKYDASAKTACSMKYAFCCNSTLTQSQVDDLYALGPVNNGLLTYFTTNSLNLKGLWSFNNAYTDLSTNSQTLTATGTPTFANVSGSDFGRGSRTTATQRQIVRSFGTGLLFNGTTAKIETALWSGTNATSSMCAWFRTRNYKTTRQTVITNGNGVTADGTSRGIAFVVSGNSTTDGSLYLLDHNIAWTDLSTKVTDALWHHVVVVLDASGHPRVYLDGSQIYYGAATTVAVAQTKSIVGADNNGSGGFFNGFIDDIRFYTSILSASDVTSLYYTGITPTTPDNWYKFDEGSGATATDSGTSAKNGTITAATYSTDMFTTTRTAA